MMTMKRMAMPLFVIALAPLLMGGGANPCAPPCPTPQTTGPVVSGTMVVDTHTNGVTFVAPLVDKAGYGSIRLQKGGRTAGAIFKLPLTFTVGLGCDVTKTVQRFGVGNVAPEFNGLRVFIDPLIVTQLLTSLGINPDAVGKPVITD